jgi:hypothetical protein
MSTSCQVCSVKPPLSSAAGPAGLDGGDARQRRGIQLQLQPSGLCVIDVPPEVCLQCPARGVGGTMIDRKLQPPLSARYACYVAEMMAGKHDYAKLCATCVGGLSAPALSEI